MLCCIELRRKLCKVIPFSILRKFKCLAIFFSVCSAFAHVLCHVKSKWTFTFFSHCTNENETQQLEGPFRVFWFPTKATIIFVHVMKVRKIHFYDTKIIGHSCLQSIILRSSKIIWISLQRFHNHSKLSSYFTPPLTRSNQITDTLSTFELFWKTQERLS